MMSFIIIIISPALIWLADGFLKFKFDFRESDVDDERAAKKRGRAYYFIVKYNKFLRYFGISIIMIGFAVIAILSKFDGSGTLYFYAAPAIGGVLYGVGVSWRGLFVGVR